METLTPESCPIAASAKQSNVKRTVGWQNFVSSLIFFAPGIALIGWAASSDGFRRGDGTLDSRICLPVAAGAALILQAVFENTRWSRTARWTAAALIGQAGALQMIDAGRLIHFQHIRSFAELFDGYTWAIFAVALQTTAVVFGSVRYLGEVKNWLLKNFGLGRLILIALLMTVAGGAVTRDLTVYARDVAAAFFIQTVNLGNILLIAFSLPANSASLLSRKFNADAAAPAATFELDRFALLAAGLTVVLAALLNLFVYQNHPHVPDEVQYLFQAKYFAAGQMTSAVPPVPEAFAMYLIPADETRWFSIFPPGWAALLAAGEKLNVVWLVNPLLAGYCLTLAYLFVQEIYSRTTARFVVILLAASPWFVFMAMSFMSHISALACALTAAVLLQSSFRRNSKFLVIAAGLMIGLLSLIRPLDAAIVGLALGFWTLLAANGGRAKIGRGFLLSAGAIVAGASVLPYNRAVTGSAWLSPMDFYYTKYFWAGANSIGFGARYGISWELDAFPGHSPVEAMINAALNIFSVNIELFGWGCGSLILAAFLTLSGKMRTPDRALLAFAALVVFAYSFYWYHGGPDFGARYWFLMIVPLAALTARGAEVLSEKIGEISRAKFDGRVIFAIFALCALSLINYLPWRAVDKYFRYLEMQPAVVKLDERHHFGKSLVLVRGANHPAYQSAWIYNPLNFEGDAPIYAWDEKPENPRKLAAAFPDRTIWIVDGNDVRGPFQAAKFIANELR